MESHYGTKGAELEPANKQLLKIFIMNITAVESANIGRPPGNTRQSHLQARYHLISEILVCGVNISRPD
ncbi:hypothetical protein D3C81_2238730 [compost metagenome]